MFLSLSMFCGFVTGAIFTQTGAIPSHQRPLQQQSPWHTNVYYSWSLIRTFFKSFSCRPVPVPAANYQDLTRLRHRASSSNCCIKRTKRCPSVHHTTYFVPLLLQYSRYKLPGSDTMKKMHGPYNNGDISGRITCISCYL